MENYSHIEMRSKIINIVVKIMRLIANSLIMSPIEEEIYYYKWWSMAMVVDILDLSLFPRRLADVVDGYLGVADGFMRAPFFRRPRLLYIGFPS